MNTEKISRSCLAKDNGMGKFQIIIALYQKELLNSTEAQRLISELEKRQCRIDDSVKKFIIDRAYRFSETELNDMLQEPERLFKAFTL